VEIENIFLLLLLFRFLIVLCKKLLNIDCNQTKQHIFFYSSIISIKKIMECACKKEGDTWHTRQHHYAINFFSIFIRNAISANHRLISFSLSPRDANNNNRKKSETLGALVFVFFLFYFF
jgi:hypothetical protein